MPNLYFFPPACVHKRWRKLARANMRKVRLLRFRARAADTLYTQYFPAARCMRRAVGSSARPPGACWEIQLRQPYLAGFRTYGPRTLSQRQFAGGQRAEMEERPREWRAVGDLRNTLHSEWKAPYKTIYAPNRRPTFGEYWRKATRAQRASDYRASQSRRRRCRHISRSTPARYGYLPP